MKKFESEKVYNIYQLNLMREHNIKVKDAYYSDEELTELWFEIVDDDKGLSLEQQEELTDLLADNNSF